MGAADDPVVATRPDPIKASVASAAERMRIRQGVAEDRRVWVADPEMRHGRKSKSQRFNGFKRYLAADVDRGLILACAITRRIARRRTPCRP